MTKIKICGLTRKEDIEAVNRWLPDYIGFVFCKSLRQVTVEQAGLLKAALNPRIKSVGVFVNAEIRFIAELCGNRIIDIVQLHGDENEEYIRALKKQMSCPIVKAVRVENVQQVLQAEQLSCDLLLLDSCQKGCYGGSGKTFDYSIIPCLQKRYLLAGGLDNGNIAQAIKKCNPYGVDISSGVETDGIKNESKIGQIIQTIRSL